MSEIERLQRNIYQKRRKTVIVFLAVVIALVTALLAFVGVTYYKMNKDTYVSYTEKGEVIYKAYLADNQFYSEEYLNGSHAYVSTLIEKMTADFSYKLQMETDNVKYQYSYKVDAQVEVKDKETGMAIYNPYFELIAPKTKVSSGKKLVIEDSVAFNYDAYNRLAKSFIAAYNLDETESTLIVRMYVAVLGESEKFANESQGNYIIKLCVPLNKATVTPFVETPADEEQGQILAVKHSNKSLYKKLVIAAAIADIALIIILVIYATVTVDKHLDYARKVTRILSNYKAYMQKINNPVDASRYDVLNVDTFTELLEIRDTLQNPILMYENLDKTCSQFFIVTATGILYMYEVKVDFGEEDLVYTEEETPIEM